MSGAVLEEEERMMQMLSQGLDLGAKPILSREEKKKIREEKAKRQALSAGDI